jgi:hypothetical protein
MLDTRKPPPFELVFHKVPYRVYFRVKRLPNGLIDRVDVVDAADDMPMVTISVRTADSPLLTEDEFFLKTYGDASDIVCQLKIAKYIEQVPDSPNSISVNSNVFAYQFCEKARKYLLNA